MLEQFVINFETAGVEANVLLIILCGVIVGYIFSTVGAAGGILTMISQVIIFGVTNVNVIKPTNLCAIIFSSIISVPLYFRERRIAIPLAINIAVGAVAGALIGVWLSVNYLEFKLYKFWFGVITCMVGVLVLYETTNRYKHSKEKFKAAPEKFEAKVKELKKSGNLHVLREHGFKMMHFSIKKMKFTFWYEEFSINTIKAIVGGFFIALIASMFGLGGGFMLVPYLSSVFALPMFIVTGTVIVIVFIISLVGISGYLMLGSYPDVAFTTIFLGGIVIGSYIGPKTQKYYREKYLRLLLAVVLLFCGLVFIGVE